MSERLAFKATIMDICKSYFTYKVHTRCGFSKVTLKGNQKDWETLIQKTQQLLKTKCTEDFYKFWYDKLMSVLNEFIRVYEGKPNVKIFLFRFAFVSCFCVMLCFFLFFFWFAFSNIQTK